MKRYLLIFIFLMSLIVVTSEENKVFVINANYNNGKITINDITVKDGYAPDRKLEVESDYKLNIYSKEDRLIYTKNIEIPMFIFADVIVDKEIKGNLIKLNQTDFALVLPYYENAGKIIILKDSKEAASYSLYSKLSFKNNSLAYYLVGFLVLAAVIFLVIKKSIQKP